MSTPDAVEAFVDEVRRSLDRAMEGDEEGIPDDYDADRILHEPVGEPLGLCAHVGQQPLNDLAVGKFEGGKPCENPGVEWVWDPVIGQYEARCHRHGLGYRVRDDEGAAKALRRLRRARTEVATVEKLYAHELATLNRWKAGALAAPAKRAKFYETHLLAYLREWRRSHPRDRSRNLPNGKLWSKQGRQSVDVKDPAAVIAWAREDPAREAAVLRPTDPDILVGPSGDKQYAGLKSLLVAEKDGTLLAALDDGTVVPGIEIVRGPDSEGVDTPDEETE